MSADLIAAERATLEAAEIGLANVLSYRAYSGSRSPGTVEWDSAERALRMVRAALAAATAPAPIAQPQPLTDEQIDHHWRAAYSEWAYRAGSFDWFAAGWRKAEAFFGIGAQEQP